MLNNEKEMALCEKYRELNVDLKNNCDSCPLRIDKRFCSANSTKYDNTVKSDFEIKS